MKLLKQLLLLVSLALLTNLRAQYTQSPQGIIVDFGTRKVELAVANTSAFRFSFNSDTSLHNQLNSPFIDTTNTQKDTFTVISDLEWCGIQTSFGKLIINTETKQLQLYNASGQLLINQGSFGEISCSSVFFNDGCLFFNDGPKTSDGILYGSGSNTHNLIKSGTTMWAYYGGHQDVPYVWNTIGYCTFVTTADNNTPADWAKIASGQVEWNCSGRAADIYLWPAATAYQALQGYTELTGKVKIPPRYAFGYLQSRWGWESRQYVEAAMDSFRTLRLPADALIYDFEWYSEIPDYSIGSTGKADFRDFGFNPGLFNEPATQIANYKNQGFRCIAIRKPRIKNTDNRNFISSKGWWHAPWNDDLDFRIDSARMWYINNTKPLLDAGIDNWWNDEGENTYTLYYWWNKAQLDCRNEVRPNSRHFTINRGYSPGNQRYGYSTWNGDIFSTWEELQNTTADLLNYGMHGLSYGSCDIGGYKGGPTNEMLTRWFEAGVFFPIMRGHSEQLEKPHFPWLWGNTALNAIRKAIELRYKLIPYYYSLAHETYETGAPIMRPLLMEFPNDPLVSNMTSQWLMGSGLLAAPLLNSGSSRKVYLPACRWYDFEKNTYIDGPVNLTVYKAIDQIPVFVREGSLLPLGPVVPHTGFDTLAPLELHIYPGKNATFNFAEDDGETYNYTTNEVRRTLFNWDENTRTLSWEVNGSFTNTHTFTTLKAVLGNTTKTATIGQSGQLVFDEYQFEPYILETPIIMCPATMITALTYLPTIRKTTLQ